MNLPTEIFGNVVVVHTPEELGSEHASRLEQFLTSLDRSRVIADLDGTESLNSDGLAALLDAHERLRDDGGELKIVTTNNVNRKIFEITRLDQQLEVCDSVIDAVKGFA